MTAKVSMIVAVDSYGGFANKGKIPWNFKEDFEWFKKKTKGYKCLMGKNTYLDILHTVKRRKNPPDQLLPDRDVTVLTSDPEIELYGSTQRTSSLEQYLYDNTDSRIIICGGERLYNDAFSYADTIYLTMIDKQFDCDRFFPVERIMKSFKIHKVDRLTDMNKNSKSKTQSDLYFVTYVRP